MAAVIAVENPFPLKNAARVNIAVLRGNVAARNGNAVVFKVNEIGRG
jgi:hypothetical protein